jgi:zinc protease
MCVTFKHWRRGAALIVLTSVTRSVPMRAQSAPGVERAVAPAIAHDRFVLPNGLVAILNEDHASPVVAVEVWYRVGSRQDPPGRSGLAHLVEHLMFEGSANVRAGEHRTLVQAMGGRFNGQTYYDHARYFDVVPSDRLEMVLWLESDRMASLAPPNEQRLDAAREIVRNEWRQEWASKPYDRLSNLITGATVFPTGHPYHSPPIGSMAEVAAVTADDARQFLRRYYSPANAIVAISGDVSPVEARRLVRKYFGPIERVEPAARPAPDTRPLAAETRLVLEDPRSKTTMLRLAWPTVSYNDPDKFALNALAGILTRNRGAALTKALVVDGQLATRVDAQNFDNEAAGLFQIDIHPRPGASLSAIEAIVDSVIAGIRLTPPRAAAVLRYAERNSLDAFKALQETLARADRLAEGEAFAGQAGAYVRGIERESGVTPADVQRAARKYLTSGRMVLSMVPGGRLDLISRPELPYANVTSTPTPDR